MNTHQELKATVEAARITVFERNYGNGFFFGLKRMFDRVIDWRASQLILADIEPFFSVVERDSRGVVVFDEFERALPEVRKALLERVKSSPMTFVISGCSGMQEVADELSLPLMTWETVNYRGIEFDGTEVGTVAQEMTEEEVRAFMAKMEKLGI